MVFMQDKTPELRLCAVLVKCNQMLIHLGPCHLKQLGCLQNIRSNLKLYKNKNSILNGLHLLSNTIIISYFCLD